MSEERGLQIVSTDLKIGDEDLVKLGVSQYGMQVLAQEQKIQRLIKETDQQIQRLGTELDVMVKDVGEYKKQAQGVAQALTSARILGLRKVDKVDVTADYRERSKGVEGTVAIHFHLHWKDGSLTHTLTRKLSKREKDVIKASDASSVYVKKLQESLLEIKAIQGRYPMLADHIRGNVTRAKLAKVAPELLKTVEINLPEFDLPALPKMQLTLPAPK
jgi:murein L,D-transpeptidase YcbB/YkuD